jgi:hypothetical protein
MLTPICNRLRHRALFPHPLRTLRNISPLPHIPLFHPSPTTPRLHPRILSLLLLAPRQLTNKESRTMDDTGHTRDLVGGLAD